MQRHTDTHACLYTTHAETQRHAYIKTHAGYTDTHAHKDTHRYTHIFDNFTKPGNTCLSGFGLALFSK